MSSTDAPSGIATEDDYVSRTGQKQAPVPVQSDTDKVDDPIDAATADSDQQLGTTSHPRTDDPGTAASPSPSPRQSSLPQVLTTLLRT
jgi:hypothetical protein